MLIPVVYHCGYGFQWLQLSTCSIHDILLMLSCAHVRVGKRQITSGSWKEGCERMKNMAQR